MNYCMNYFRIISQIVLSFLVLCSVCTIKLSAQDVKTFYNSGQDNYKHLHYKEAIDDYTRVITLDSMHVSAYLQRGFCKGMVKDFSGAIEDFTKVIEMDSTNKYAYISRGSAKNKTGEFQNAMDDFNKALGIDPTDQEAYNNRGFSKKGLGDFKGACEDWYVSKRMGNEESIIILKNNRCK